MAERTTDQVLPAARRAGVCLHVTSLPGRFGIGEIGPAASGFIDTLRRMQLGVWQFLPLGPTAYGDSPYQSLSTFAGNELLISTDELLRQSLLEPGDVEALARLPDEYVDYGRLVPLKYALLDKAADRFTRAADADRKMRFDEFVDRFDASWLHDYALFRVLKAEHGQRPWPKWRSRFAGRDPAALKQLADDHAEHIERLKVIQFLFHDQWQRLRNYANEQGILLFGDMPFYIALDSADAWANPDLFRLDRRGRPDTVAGVPPDYFSANGQRWGNPLYEWSAHRQSDFRWWTDRMRSTLDSCDLVRIDHFRGFESYWAVPARAKTARKGIWEQGPGDAIFDAMRSRLGPLPVVAEDLGVITPAVEALRDRHGFPGMVVLQFSMTEPDFDLGAVRENCVCYTGTHDNDTALGWIRGNDGGVRNCKGLKKMREIVLARTGGNEATIASDLIRMAFASPARLAMAPMQDYLGLGSEARLNTPGKAGGNWRWRLRDDAPDENMVSRIARLVRDAGRAVDAETSGETE